MNDRSLVIRNIGTLLTNDRNSGGSDGDGVVRDAALVISGGRVSWAGPDAGFDGRAFGHYPTVDAGGRLVTPGLVECHSHLVFAGGRQDEFESRATGVSYEEIARRGGGIVRTVAAVRAASATELTALAIPRAYAFLTAGVTTLEIKTGYGLTLEDEMKMLHAIRMLAQQVDVSVVPTFLGAHAFPREVTDRAAHVDQIVSEWIPAVADSGLARFCDVFCEKVAFGLEDSERILDAAVRHGLGVKVHADQLSAMGASALAARKGAVSADHLDHASDGDISAMAAAGTVGVLFPGCPVSLCNHRWPDARRFIAGGMKVAVSTDFNPGSSVTTNLPLMGSFAMAFMGMSAIETWGSLTVNAAAALGLNDGTGTLAPGAPADVVVWHSRDPGEPFYCYGMNHVAMVFRNGRLAVSRSECGEVTVNRG